MEYTVIVKCVDMDGGLHGDNKWFWVRGNITSDAGAPENLMVAWMNTSYDPDCHGCLMSIASMYVRRKNFEADASENYHIECFQSRFATYINRVLSED